MIVGLDIGSTNSCAAYFDGRAARMIELADGSTIIPSVVTIADDECLVGHDAIAAGRMQSEFMYRNWKRRLGEHWHDMEDTGYQTMEGPDGLLSYRGPEGHIFLPEDLTGFVIYQLLRAAQDKLGEMPTGAVLCVPADFIQSQRDAAERAAALAMAQIQEEDGKSYPFQLELMHEPTAAALASGYDSKKAIRLFVVDLGGGTLDVSLQQSGGGLTRVLTTNGIRDCGGIDWDKSLAEFVVSMWRTEHPDLVDPMTRDAAMALIYTEAEDVKKRLSIKTETEFRIEDFDRDEGGVDLHLSYKITRKAFEEMTAPLVRRVIGACQIAMEDARRIDPNFSPKDLHDVLLVGGMTRMPAIQEAVKDFFQKTPNKKENPDQIVALGAAIRGAMIEGRRPDLAIQEITTHTLAVEVAGDVAGILFPKGHPFPAEVALSVTNENDNQRQLSARLIHGDANRASSCELLAATEHPIEPCAAKTARVPLIAKLDASGRPWVSVGGIVIYGGEEEAA